MSLNHHKKVLHIGDLCHVAVMLRRGLSNFGIQSKVLISSGAYVPEIGLSINPLINLGFLKYLYTFIYILGHFDWILHCHGMAGVFPFILGKKYILHCHGSDLRELPCRLNVMGWMFKHVVRKANLVFVSTPDLIFTYQEQGFDLTKVKYLPNPVDFDANANSIKMPRSSKLVKLFCPSSSHQTKYKARLIHAYKILYIKYSGRISLTLIDHERIGQDDIFLEELNNILDGDALKNVEVIKKCDHESLINLYDHFDIVLDQFSDMRCHGVIAYEACAKRKPVISTIGERLFPGSGIQPGSSVKEIILSVSNIIDNDLYDKLGKKSYNWGKSNHSINAVAKKLINYYQTSNFNG